MTTTNIPTSGVLRRIGVDVDVVVGRFDQIDKQTTHGKEKLLLPDLSQCIPPMKILRHTNPVGTKKQTFSSSSSSSSSSTSTATHSTTLSSASATTPARKTSLDNADTITIQDSSGKQVYLGTKQELDNNYIVILRENTYNNNNNNNSTLSSTNDTSSATYRVLPVSHWYTFVKQSNVPALSVQEQEELYEIMQASVQRPSMVRAAINRLRDEENGIGSSSTHAGLANEGGIANDDTLELIDGDNDREGNYRTSYLQSLKQQSVAGKRRGRNGGVIDDDTIGVALEREGDFEAAYAELEGGGGGGGEGEDEYGNNGRRRGYAGAMIDSSTLTKSYDFTGFEGNADEQAADVIQDYFVDDEGDDGRINADDVNFIIGNDNKGDEEVEEGATFVRRSVEDDEDGLLDPDAEDIDADKLASEAASLAYSKMNEDEEAAINRRKAEIVTDENIRDIKRGRIDDTTVRAEIISFLKSQGGQATKDAIVRNFKRVAKDKDFRKRFLSLLGELTKNEIHMDGNLYFVLKVNK